LNEGAAKRRPIWASIAALLDRDAAGCGGRAAGLDLSQRLARVSGGEFSSLSAINAESSTGGGVIQGDGWLFCAWATNEQRQGKNPKVAKEKPPRSPRRVVKSLAERSPMPFSLSRKIRAARMG
jgi:hypothetical protein